jgi:hypothetical protein
VPGAPHGSCPSYTPGQTFGSSLEKKLFSEQPFPAGVEEVQTPHEPLHLWVGLGAPEIFRLSPSEGKKRKKKAKKQKEKQKKKQQKAF